MDWLHQVWENVSKFSHLKIVNTVGTEYLSLYENLMSTYLSSFNIAIKTLEYKNRREVVLVGFTIGILFFSLNVITWDKIGLTNILLSSKVFLMKSNFNPEIKDQD